MSPEPKEDKKTGLQLSTLLISSAAAVAAAIVVPTFWERGSLIATAVTPIIVALVSEALNRPAKAISNVPTRVRKTRAEEPAAVGASGPDTERWGGDAEDPFGLHPGERPRRSFPWKLGIATGLTAAVIGAGVVTASELAIFGHSVSGKERSTSVFGGSRDAADDEETPTPTPTATETATEAPTETPTAEPTETPTPEATATATPSAVPTETATPPAATPTVAPQETVTPVPTP